MHIQSNEVKMAVNSILFALEGQCEYDTLVTAGREAYEIIGVNPLGEELDNALTEFLREYTGLLQDSYGGVTIEFSLDYPLLEVFDDSTFDCFIPISDVRAVAAKYFGQVEELALETFNADNESAQLLLTEIVLFSDQYNAVIEKLREMHRLVLEQYNGKMSAEQASSFMVIFILSEIERVNTLALENS